MLEQRRGHPYSTNAIFSGFWIHLPHPSDVIHLLIHSRTHWLWPQLPPRYFMDDPEVTVRTVSLKMRELGAFLLGHCCIYKTQLASLKLTQTLTICSEQQQLMFKETAIISFDFEMAINANPANKITFINVGNTL